MGLVAFQRQINQITDLGILAYEVVLAARRMIIPTLLGLIIALTVISQSSILIESYRQKIFEELIYQESYYRDNSDLSLQVSHNNLHTSGLSRTGGSKFFTNFTEHNRIINNSLELQNYTQYLADRKWYSELVLGVWLNTTNNYYGSEELDIYAERMLFYASACEEFYDAIQSLMYSQGRGRLPQNSSELLLVRPQGLAEYEWDREREEVYENLTVGTQLNISLKGSHYAYENYDFSNQTATIVGVLEFNREYMYRTSPLPDDVTNIIKQYLTPYIPWEGYFFFYNRSSFNLMIDSLIQGAPEYSVNGYVAGKFTFDRSKFNVYNINQEITRLEDVIDVIELKYYQITTGVYLSCPLLEQMERYEARIQELNLFLLLISIPVLSIALYLVNFSFQLIRRQKQEQIGIIKTRGGSWGQLLIILIAEMLFSTLIAVFIGFVLSTILADIVMRSTDFLEFSGSGIPVIAPVETLRSLITIGVIIALLLNFRRIYKMSRMKITETLDPTKEQSPLWKRFYLDYLMFGFGTVIWLVLMSLLESISTPTGEFNPIIYILYPIFFLLGIPSPFLMLFGSLMIVSRIFPILIDKIGNFLWNLRGGIHAFSVRNVIRHKRAANRAVLLITFSLAFAILSTTLVYSLEETTRMRYYYEEGSDMSLTIGQDLNASIKTILEENISDISHVSEIFMVQEFSSGYIGISYTMMFVDPFTFAETSYQSSIYGLSDSISSLMEDLKDNKSIILLKTNLERSVSVDKIGDNISLTFNNVSGTITVPTRVVGTFKYWPSMYPEPWLDYNRDYFLVGSLGLYDTYSSYFTNVKAKYLMKLAPQANAEIVSEEIKNKTDISPNSPMLKFEEYKVSFDRHFTLSILNSDLLVTITISVIGVIMFGFFTLIERSKEIGVERALGMTRRQTAQSLLIEASTILGFGLVIGCIAGMYFASMFLRVLSVGFAIPPSILSYPLDILVRMMGGIVLAAVLGTIVPAMYATRRDISRILKVE